MTSFHVRALRIIVAVSTLIIQGPLETIASELDQSLQNGVSKEKADRIPWPKSRERQHHFQLTFNMDEGREEGMPDLSRRFERRRGLRNRRPKRNNVQLPGKRGIGLTMRDEGLPGSWVENVPLLKFLKPSWHYSWNRILPPEARVKGIEFIPMIWTGGSYSTVKARIEADVMPDFVAGKTKRLLGFNEPDQVGQANMAVSTAVECWPALEETGMLLGSPVVANNSGTWLSEWMDQVDRNNFRIDYVAVHWYSKPNVRAFKVKMRELYQMHGGRTPLLITEFAPADWSASSVEDNALSTAEVLAFMKKVLPWLQTQSWIAGYAWFPFRTSSVPGTHSALFDDEGNPTVLAEFYATVTATNPQGDQSIGV